MDNNGKAIMYADKITNSMQKTLDETNYRREKQMSYNTENNIIPKALNKSIEIHLPSKYDGKTNEENILKVAEATVDNYLTKDEIQKLIKNKKKDMENAAKALDFIQAAKFRDELKQLEAKL